MVTDKDIKLIFDFLADKLDKQDQKSFVERLKTDNDFKNEFLDHLTTKEAVYDNKRMDELLAKLSDIKVPPVKERLGKLLEEIENWLTSLFPKNLQPVVRPALLVVCISLFIYFGIDVENNGSQLDAEKNNIFGAPNLDSVLPIDSIESDSTKIDTPAKIDD